MYAPRVFASMIGVLLVFALAIYWSTGSFFTALWQTVVCAVILQVGYFIGLLYLLRRERRQREREGFAGTAKRSSEARGNEDLPADAAANLKTIDR